jgi:predicted sugar kinase
MANVDGRLCQLGIALQYPPIQLAARDSGALTITGGRADLARQQAEQLLAYHRLPPAGEVEIELAVPSFMGLGSAPLLGLSMAAVFAALNNMPTAGTAGLARAAGLLTDDDALEEQAFAQGGLLLVDRTGQAPRRQPIPPRGDNDDWVWVLVLPKVPAEAPDALEHDRHAALWAAAGQLDAATGPLAAELLDAAARDDIAAFAQALERIQLLNQAALDQIGQLAPLSEAERQILAVMREHGALACGRAPGGLMLYALIRGGGPSRDMRRALVDHLGIFGGNVMASIADNAGAKLRVVG